MLNDASLNINIVKTEVMMGVVKEYLCLMCGETNPDKFYHKNNMKTRCKKCHTMSTHQKKRDLKVKAIEYLGGKCVRCGYEGVPAVYDFHHRDGETKEFSWGDFRTTSWEILKAEIDKCDLLCANCHREVHDEMWYMSLADTHPEKQRRSGVVP